MIGRLQFQNLSSWLQQMLPSDRWTLPHSDASGRIFFAPNHCATRIANPLLSPFSQPVTKNISEPVLPIAAQCPHPEKLSCYDRICNVIKLLKDVSEKHGNHKLYDQFYRLPDVISRMVLFPPFFSISCFPFFYPLTYDFPYLERV